MKAIFVDTAGWMLLSDSNDPFYLKGIEFRDKWLNKGGIFVTTDYVVDETLTLLRTRLHLTAAEKWWQAVSNSSRISWEYINSVRSEEARALFFGWRDQKFSFTDCTSFVVMRELGIDKALTSDKHFVRAGFTLVPGKG